MTASAGPQGQAAEVSPCQHEFKVIKQPELYPSHVENVYYFCDYPHEFGIPVSQFMIQCSLCGQEQVRHVPDTCPRCLKGIDQPEQTAHLIDPQQQSGWLRYNTETYFGRDIYASWAYVRTCSCGFGYAFVQFDH